MLEHVKSVRLVSNFEEEDTHHTHTRMDYSSSKQIK